MIAILGCGRIGEALLTGLLSAGWTDIVVTSRTQERAAALREQHGVEASTDNAAAVREASLVVVAVKPQDIDALLAEVGPLLTPEHTVLSVAAAIPTAQVEARVAPGVPVVRAMPNAPSTVHEGMAGICAGAHAGEEHLALAEDALAHLGRVVRVPESQMDAVTALSGSGPAYFALLAEAMIEAGILLGVSRDIDDARRADDARDGEAVARPRDASGRAARIGHLAGRDDYRRNPRARAGRRARGTSQRGASGDDARRGACEGA